MATYLLGAGPLTYDIYEYFSSCGEQVFLVSQRSRVLSKSLHSMTYLEFCERNINECDNLVIAWRSLDFTKDSSLLDKTLDFVMKKISIFNRVLYLSSGAIFGNSNFFFTEESPSEPVSQYAIDKFSLENWLSALSMKNLVILRISNAFGRKESNDLINRISNAWLNDPILEVYEPTSFARDYMPIQVISKIVFHMLNQYKSLEVINYFNVSSGQVISTAEILESFRAVRPSKIRVISEDIPEGIPRVFRINNSKILEEFPSSRVDALGEITNFFLAKIASQHS